MTSITIKDIPDTLLVKLRTRAERDKRSMNKEVIHLLNQALSELAVDNSVRLRDQAAAQFHVWSRLAGQWESDQDTTGEINEIYRARTEGRSTEL